MKKLLLCFALSVPFLASATDNFNTLDSASSVSLSGATPAGGNIIGKVGIDQTTPGTTNAVQANAGTNLNTSALALDATVSAQSAKLPTSLGAKTGATSLSVVPNTDTAFPVSAASLPLPTGAALDASITATTGTKAAGTAAASAVLTGAVYNSTLPAPSTGQQTALQVDSTGRLRVNASEVASGTTDSGNPVKVGGVAAATTLPVLTNGQRGDLQITTGGALVIAAGVYAGTSGTDAAASLYGFPTRSSTTLGGSPSPTAFGGYAYNSVSDKWDRIRSGVVVPTATLTGHQNSLPWAIYNATPTVRTEAQGGPLQSDSNGALNVATHAVTQSGTWTIAPGAAATGGYSFSNLKANATTTVKSGAGTLHTISVNTKGLTNTVTVYDNTAGSGTTIATLDTTLGQDTLTFDLAFATGLTVVIAGGTAADITVTYK